MKITFGASSDIGNRNSQQDAYHVKLRYLGKDDCHLFAVMDGHGAEGDLVANFIKNHLEESLVELREKPDLESIDAYLKLTFSSLTEQLSASGIDTYMSGTTIVLAVIIGHQVHIANVGDSKAYLVAQTPSGSFHISQLSIDHICANDLEKDRVISAGARVDYMIHDDTNTEDRGPLRIFKGSLPYPGLVVTRSLGDNVVSKFGVIDEPFIHHLTLTPEHKFLILSSDGVSDGLSPEELIPIIQKYKNDVQETSKQITVHSLKGLDSKEIDDNTTNIVIRFEW